MCGRRERFANAAQRHRLGRVARTDDADRARAFARAQDLAARDERAEDLVGQVAARLLITCRNVRRGDREHAARLATRARVRYARWPVRKFSSPRKRPGPCVDDHDVAVDAVAHDLGLAFEHDEEVVLVGAGASRGRRPTATVRSFAERRELGELLLGQRRARVACWRRGLRRRCRPWKAVRLRRSPGPAYSGCSRMYFATNGQRGHDLQAAAADVVEHLAGELARRGRGARTRGTPRSARR